MIYRKEKEKNSKNFYRKQKFPKGFIENLLFTLFR